MRALANLIIAGAALALISSPASAGMGRVAAIEMDTKAATAQQACVGWGVRCEPEVLPEYCIAADKCATALPASMLVRYDALMDAAATR
jgi:hypothetical protein